MPKLDEYNKKRDFNKTPEPKEGGKPGKKLIYVIQKHHARALHYDFRIENNGVLVSWAVPRGPSMNPADKRLAVMTEDHPMDYANFEGQIPSGNYGAGLVIVWDHGHFVNITEKQEKIQPLSEAIAKGHFMIWVKGDKINGGFALTKMKDNQWLLVKMNDEFAEKKEGLVPEELEPTNLTKELFSGIKKKELIDYYHKIAPHMLKHTALRPLSMFRFPGGVSDKKKFFQKEIPEYFPKWFDRIKVEKTTYPLMNSENSIEYVANQSTEMHLFTSRRNNITNPDKMVFDLDPSQEDIELLRDIATRLKDFLEDIGFETFLMTTGGKGFHITVPIIADSTNDEVREFSGKIAHALEKNDPKNITIQLSKNKREDKVFIDVNRNSRAQTSISPYSVRAKEGAPVAFPILWSELEKSEPNTYTIKNVPKIVERRGDAWEHFFDKAVSIKDVKKRLKG